MQTRKYPRTMQQAFGPYVNHSLHGMDNQPKDKSAIAEIFELVFAAAGIVGTITLVTIVMFWGGA